MIFNQKWQGCAAPDKKYGEFFDVTVPGNIQKDYAAFMGWGDINWMDNCKKYEDTESWYWVYKTDVEYSKKDGEKVFFVTKGIEYEYDVVLNGKVLTHHEGMFSTVEIDITDELENGNKLEIVIYPHPMIEGAEGRSNAAQSCKPAVSYGWDWHPRTIVSGIFDETYIETRGEAYLHDAEAKYTLSEDRTSADVHFEIECDAPVTIEIKDMDGKVVYSGCDCDFHLDNINLWWCNGQGTPYLYTYTVSSSENSLSGTIGFKTIKLVMNGEDAWFRPEGYPKGRSTAPIQIELNGRKVFAKGSNWVNPEIFTATITPEKYETQVIYAKEANMNIFRCWGGANVDKESFFDACDKHGIMVWQEFPLACNNYVGTPKYLKVLAQEAPAIVKRVRRHACHVLWCGGNELFNGWSQMTEQSHALRLLDKVCYEEDFYKPFIMTSPIKGMGHGHYVFLDGITGDTVFEIYRNSHKTAYSEFGNPSIASYEQLQSIFDEQTLNNPDPSPDSMWTVHCGYRAWGLDTWCCFGILKKIFGKQDSIKEYIEKSNILQSEGYKCIFEEARKQAPTCSMVINWDYNEPWKNAAGNNLIEYPDTRKPAYYAVASALRPTMPSIRAEHFSYKPGDVFNAELWILNDAPVGFDGDTVEVYFEVNGEKKHIMSWNTGKADVATNIRGHKFTVDIPDGPTQMMKVTLEAKCGVSEYSFLLDNNPPEGEVFIPKLNF